MPFRPLAAGKRPALTLAAAALITVLGAGYASAQANPNCSSLLPICFAPNTPAIADDINANFKKVADYTVPLGGIIMWSGASVPTGWALCNGQVVNGVATPDLRGRFVMGATASAPIGTTGGTAAVTLTVDQLPTHNHGITSDGWHAHSIMLDTGGGGSVGGGNMITASYCSNCAANDLVNSNGAGTHNHGGATGAMGGSKPFDVLPPYYALAYIMKVR